MQSFARPKRSLGQNFLSDPNICRRIVKTLQVDSSAPILEIGPGRGALTRFLAEHPGPVMALEKDSELIHWLREEFSGLSVIHGDGLEFCWEGTNRLNGLGIIGNLPYNVASPMIWEIVSRARSWRSLVFMVPKEVAERLAAASGTRAYGALSAWVGNFAKVEYVFTVPPHVFKPQPKVDSAVVRFTPLDDPAWREREALSWLLKILFQMRRKQLGTILKRYWSAEVDAWCAEHSLDRTIRPEGLSPGLLRSLAVVLGTQRSRVEG